MTRYVATIRAEISADTPEARDFLLSRIQGMPILHLGVFATGGTKGQPIVKAVLKRFAVSRVRKASRAKK